MQVSVSKKKKVPAPSPSFPSFHDAADEDSQSLPAVLHDGVQAVGTVARLVESFSVLADQLDDLVSSESL